MGLLLELFNKYGTDKGDYDQAHRYDIMYENLMEHRRREVTAVLEIGLGGEGWTPATGASAKAWLDYFPNAQVTIIENSTSIVDAFTQKFKHPRLTVVVAEQQDEQWSELFKNNHFDFIIDDGSHVPEHQLATFENTFRKLKSHGIYFIEDTHCNFHPNFNPDNYDKLYPRLFDLVMIQQMLSTGTGDFYKASKGNSFNIFAFHLYKSVIAFEKA